MWSKTAVVCASSEASSSLQLAFDLVQKAPIGGVGDNLLRGRFDKARLVEPKSVKPDRILGIILPPFVVAVFPERLQRIVVSSSDAAIDEPPSRGLGFAGAGVRRHEDGAQGSLGRDRVLADVFSVARQHAAEILRPWPVDHRLDDHMPDALCP